MYTTPNRNHRELGKRLMTGFNTLTPSPRKCRLCASPHMPHNRRALSGPDHWGQRYPTTVCSLRHHRPHQRRRHIRRRRQRVAKGFVRGQEPAWTATRTRRAREPPRKFRPMMTARHSLTAGTTRAGQLCESRRGFTPTSTPRNSWRHSRALCRNAPPCLMATHLERTGRRNCLGQRPWLHGTAIIWTPTKNTGWCVGPRASLVTDPS